MKTKSRVFFIFILPVAFFVSTLVSKAQYYYGEKPLFVTIGTSWCHACNVLKPTVEALKIEYASSVEFLELDLSNEETTKLSENKAFDYGISNFFNSNRRAFPTVGILNPYGKVEQVFVGGQHKETLKAAIDNLLGLVSTQIAAGEPIRPPEVEIEKVKGGRPDEPKEGRPEEVDFLDRPQEVLSNGRPSELKFWAYNQPLPCYAYNRLIVLPLCNGSNNTLCASNIGTSKTNEKDYSNPNVYKPWTPFATRDEKGLQLKK